LTANASKADVLSEPLDAVVERALEFVRDGALVGLGSGRAASAFIHALARRVKAGLTVRGIPTSEATARLAREVGVPLAELGETRLDVTVDGADEVDPRLDLIKGYGGALVRERIVAAASRLQVILVGAEKLVPALGARGRLPVEVIPFAVSFCRSRLDLLGCRAALRVTDGRPFVTDNGNRIFDCAIAPPPDPPALDRAIRGIPGVVDTGFFLGTAHLVLVAEGGCVRVLRREEASHAG
jgi:ribose 5-phosphate isomerase A